MGAETRPRETRVEAAAGVGSAEELGVEGVVEERREFIDWARRICVEREWRILVMRP